MEEAMIREILIELEKLLRDPTVAIAMKRGVHRTPNPTTGYWEYAPTAGKEITISVQGGATETEESPIDRLRRSMGK